MSESLTHEDFRVEDGKLRLAKRGAVAVLIMSKTPESIQLVKTLASINVNNLHTAYLDISQGKNRDVILLSRNTATAITSLPYLAFFYDGKLKCRYKGDVNKAAMSNYFQDKIIEVATQSSSSARKSETISSTNMGKFTMATSGDKNKPTGGKVIPVDNSIIGYNRAWLVDQK